MRILAITNLFPSPMRPQWATFNRHQIRALAAEQEVTVIAPIAWTDERAARHAGAPGLPPDRRLVWEGIQVEYPHYRFVPRAFRGLQGRFYRWSIQKAFRHAVTSFRPDVVYATWAYPDGWAAVDLAHRAGLPVVLKVHGSDILLLDQHPNRRRGTVEAIRHADQVVAVSQDLANKLMELGVDPNRVHLVYNGVDADVFKPGPAEDCRKRLGLAGEKSLLLFVGNLLPVKGIDVLIEACAILKNKSFEFELHVVGKGTLRPELERRVRQLGLDDCVKFRGVIPNEQLPDWYRAATLLVLPSRSEGVANVLLEAAACGTPFVASDVGGVREIVHLGDGLLVTPNDPAQLAEVIGAALSRLPRQQRLEPFKGRSHADAARELVGVFNEAIHDYASPRVGTNPDSKSTWRQLARRGLAFLLPRKLLMVRGSQSIRSICLTFDDGPHPDHTPRLLDFLSHEGISATFFVVGREAEKHPELVRRMAAEGHAVGSHSYSHPKRAELSRLQMAQEVSRGKAVLENILGSKSLLYRPPQGKVTAPDLLWMWRAGLTVVLWNVDPRDYASTSADTVRDWFRGRTLQPGDVVLFHDTHPHALAVLPDLIRSARGRGLSFTTVREWIK
jgi:glycosyltransferase involved in cell wall biosynthesis/peptidoglycan/xylan/chitin deacetylase (PgdA/CDA1 family)